MTGLLQGTTSRRASSYSCLDAESPVVLLMISTRIGAPQVAFSTSPARYLSAKFPRHRLFGFSAQMRQAMSGQPWFLRSNSHLNASPVPCRDTFA